MKIRWPRLLNPSQLCQFLRNQKNPLTALQVFHEAKSRYPNYSHNGPVYAAIINILGSSGQIREMKEVINLMKDDSCQCKDSAFATAIKTYANAGLLDEAISLFKSLPQFNCVNWTESFNTLLQIVVKESKLETAQSLFMENSLGWGVKSWTHSLKLLMDALCKHNRSDLALQVLQEMNYHCCYPDRETYGILMRGLCEDGRLNEATHLLYSMFWRISQKGCGEDVVIYRTLLNALCDNRQVQEAVEILNKVLRKGLKSPKRCIKPLDLAACCNGVDIQHVKNLINGALLGGMIPNLASYCAMAVDLYSEGGIDVANKVLDVMHERGFRPLLAVYEAKVAALCREGCVYDAVEVLELEMSRCNCVPNVKMHNIVLKGLCDEGNSALAVEYLEKMTRQVGCIPDKETYNILVNGLCFDFKFVEASAVLGKMLSKNHFPGVEMFNNLISGLCLVGRQYEAIMWLEEMISQGKLPEVLIWDSLVASVCCNLAETDVSAQTLNLLTSSS